jgi:hypothetical protein
MYLKENINALCLKWVFKDENSTSFYLKIINVLKGVVRYYNHNIFESVGSYWNSWVSRESLVK